MDSCFGYGIAANARAAQAKMRSGNRRGRRTRDKADAFGARLSALTLDRHPDFVRVMKTDAGAMLNELSGDPINQNGMNESEWENGVARIRSDERKPPKPWPERRGTGALASGKPE
ncbi:hypothetical protein [Burkholderia sp. MSMB617WGS]|uniref:hypothetical protein n=1 Tax=Burkholderia sp. MSMB617WGS TaxID=1637831 RepID=UPI00164946E4|nr:hypothetical protein [Burkholderia sp. MSMB617WGS]